MVLWTMYFYICIYMPHLWWQKRSPQSLFNYLHCSMFSLVDWPVGDFMYQNCSPKQKNYVLSPELYILFKSKQFVKIHGKHITLYFWHIPCAHYMGSWIKGLVNVTLMLVTLCFITWQCYNNVIYVTYQLIPCLPLLYTYNNLIKFT